MKGVVCGNARGSLAWLAVLLAIVLSASAGQADKAADWGTIQLANVGDEPGASGEATLTNVRVVDWYVYTDSSWWDPYPDVVYYTEYTGHLSVTCHNLQPGATYSTPVGSFVADLSGTATVKGRVAFQTYAVWNGWVGWKSVPAFGVPVARLESDSSSVMVLAGGILAPGY